MSFLAKFKGQKFIRNVITVASGTAMAQLITLLFSPLITRLYGPESFGVLGTFNSFLNIFTTSIALTYPLAIVLPKEDVEAKNLIKVSFIIGFVISFMLSIIVIFRGEEILKIFNVDVLIPYIYFLPFIFLFTVGRQIGEQWLIRKKEYKTTAKISIWQSFIMNISKVTGGLISPIGTTLIFITTLGQGLYMGMLMWGSRKSYFSQDVKNLKEPNTTSYLTLVKTGKEYSDFPTYRAPQVLIASITQSMPILLLAAFFGPIASGFYTLGMTVLSLPSQLIGKSVGDVFYPRIAEAAHKKENLSAIIKKATYLLVIIGIIPFGIIIFLGPTIFSLIFGDDWERAGIYASWIALWSYALFISNPSIRALSVIGAQKFYLIFTILNILFRGCALLIGAIVFKDDFLAVVLYSIIGAVLSIILTVITIYKSKSYISSKF